MTTIHAEAILAWAQNSRNSFGIGGHGAMASEDMMRMMAIAVGGKEELQPPAVLRHLLPSNRP